MTKIRSFLNRFQLQYRRTSTLNKVVIAAMIVLSSVTLLALRLAQWETEENLAQLRKQAAALEQRNNELRQDIDELGTADSYHKIAQEELGLVDPDTIIFERAD